MLAGRYIGSQLPSGGAVVQFDGLIGSDAAILRANGFEESIEKFAGIEVVERDSASWDREIAANKMSAFLQKHSSIDAVFAANDEMALGVVAAVREFKATHADFSEPLVVGFDATDEGLQAIERGELAATVAQQPIQMGALCIEQASQIISGGEVESEVAVEVLLVTEN